MTGKSSADVSLASRRVSLEQLEEEVLLWLEWIEKAKEEMFKENLRSLAMDIAIGNEVIIAQDLQRAFLGVLRAVARGKVIRDTVGLTPGLPLAYGGDGKYK